MYRAGLVLGRFMPLHNRLARTIDIINEIYFKD